MSLLTRIAYDPTAAASAGSALAAMTAVDTTNCRVKFKAPINGKVLCKIKGTVGGAATLSRYLFGILEGTTVKARMQPIGAAQGTIEANSAVGQEAVFCIEGLTAGQEYTWDLAYSIQKFETNALLRFGGGNDTTAGGSYGAIVFEVWKADNLLVSKLYDPATAATKTTSAAVAMAAFDTANLRNTFTAPSTGNVMWRIAGATIGSTVQPALLLGVLEGSTVKSRVTPIQCTPTAIEAKAGQAFEASAVITGLTAGTSYSFDAAFGADKTAASNTIQYGGANAGAENTASGALAYEIWAC